MSASGEPGPAESRTLARIRLPLRHNSQVHAAVSNTSAVNIGRRKQKNKMAQIPQPAPGAIATLSQNMRLGNNDEVRQKPATNEIRTLTANRIKSEFIAKVDSCGKG
jgi:hypothetical protein